MVSLKTVGGFFSVAIFSLGLAACGGDSQVSGSKKMTDLTAAEKQDLCDEGKDSAAAHADAIKKIGCYLSSAFTGTCSETDVQTCLAKPDDPPDAETCHVDVTAACTATVGELRACSDATFAALESATNGLTCANFADKFGTLQTEPAACATAKQKCPELFTNEDPGTP
jgi:hypothetical protein